MTTNQKRRIRILLTVVSAMLFTKSIYGLRFQWINSRGHRHTIRQNTVAAREVAAKVQVDELLSWAQCFDKADIGTKHLIVSRLIERVDVRTGYKVHIKFKISLKQFLGQE